jgi:hypothetical protein
MNNGNLSARDLSPYGGPQLHYSRAFISPERANSGDAMLGAMIWAPSLAVATALLALGQPVAGMVVLALALLAHSLFRPHVAVYALIAAIPLEWLVTFIPRVSTVTKLLGLFALLVALPRLFTAAMPTRWDRSGRWIVLLILWALLSCFWAPYPSYGFLAWQSFALRWGIAVLICLQLTNKQRIRMGMIVLIVASSLAATVLVGSRDARATVSGSERDELTSFVGQDVEKSGSLNLQSRYTAVAIISAFYLALTGGRNWKRTLLLGTIPLLLVAILLLKGRAVWLGLPAALVATVFLLRGAGLGRRVILLITILFVGTISGLLLNKLGLFGQGIQERFNSIFEKGAEAGSRIEFWKLHLAAFLRSGGLGVGFSQMTTGIGGSYKVAHNDIISITGELGVVGVFLFICFHASIYRRVRRIPHIWPKALCLMVWCFMLAVGITENDYLTKFYALATGLILGVIRIEEENTGNAEPALFGVPNQTQ